MYLHTGALAIRSHRGILLGEYQIDGGYLWESLADNLDHSSRHMLQQLRGLLYFTRHEIVEFRIVQRISDFIALHSPFQGVSDLQIKHEIRPHLSFLRQHPVKSMETDLP